MTFVTTQASPPGDKAAATRASIVDTAEGLFRAMGYQKTAVADIARELGMSPANVYRFFPTKAAINEAICQRILGGIDAVVWTIARGPGTPEDRLRSLFKALEQQTISMFFQEKKLHDMVIAAIEEHWPVIEGHIESVEKAIRHIVMDGQASGAFVRMDADEAAHLIHASTIAFSHPMVVAQCAQTSMGWDAAHMAEWCLRALRPNS